MSAHQELKKLLLRISPTYRRQTYTIAILRAAQADNQDAAASLNKQIRELRQLTSDLHAKTVGDLLTRLESQQLELATLKKEIEAIQSSVNFASLARLSRRGNQPIICLFIIHNIEVWSAQKPIYEQMLKDARFRPIVASCNRKYPSGSAYINEHIVHFKLEQLKVPHVRLGHEDSFVDLGVVRRICPDVIIKQSIWDADVPPAFATKYLTFARLYSISYYSLPMTEAPSSYLDHDYSRLATSNFVLNDAIKEDYELHAQGMAKIVATGHPKIDEIIATRASWPLDTGNKIKIFWVAHHAIFNDWINFGLLPKIYKSMLRLAREHPEIDILFSPHPGLIGVFERLEREDKELSDGLKKFYDDWRKLPNTGTLEHGGGIAEMKASDMMIIDGASMLVDYQVLDKPILFLERRDHAPFNRFGKMMADGANTLHNFSYTAIEAGVLRVKDGESDKQKEQRQINKAFLTQYKNAGKNIVESIASDFS